MKSVNYYRSLPDSMHEGHLVKELQELLDEVHETKEYRGDFLNALHELAERQWRTYTVLCQVLRSRIEESLIYYWDGYDLEYVSGAIYVAARLGLVEFLSFLSLLSDDELSPEVAVEVEGAIAELEKDIGHPYSGMN